MKILKKLALFGIGGGAYVGLEVLYRGYSHVSMFGAGGACFLLLGRLRRVNASTVVRAGLGAGVITAVELATGLLVNRDFRVWDYRDQPGNLLGQICPAFAAVWAAVSLAAMGLYGWADCALDRAMGPFRPNGHGFYPIGRISPGAIDTAGKDVYDGLTVK